VTLHCVSRKSARILAGSTDSCVSFVSLLCRWGIRLRRNLKELRPAETASVGALASATSHQTSTVLRRDPRLVDAGRFCQLQDHGSADPANDEAPDCAGASCQTLSVLSVAAHQSGAHITMPSALHPAATIEL
jgi:hypothetical protein